MSIYVLYAVFLLNGQPHVVTERYQTLDQCEADRTKIIDTLVANGVAEGGAQCYELKIGTFN
jgi:hypothetical protein